MTQAGLRTEQLWMNYQAPKLLMTTGAGGRNRTERQQLKRKVERITKRFDALPNDHRAILITHIINNYG